MELVEISEENLEDFRELLGEDLSEDVKRVYYNGIGALDGEGRAVGALVYELFDSESEEDTRSRICFFSAGNKEISDSLENHYSNISVSENEIVESFFELGDEETAKALNGYGFSLEEKKDDILTITLGEIAETELGKKRKLPDHVGNIGDLSILQFREAVKQILFKGHMGIMEDIPYLPKTWFDNGVSACISSGGKIPGLFLIRRTPSGVLIPALFFAYGPECSKDLLYMIGYSVQKALELYPPETVVSICRRDAATKALTAKLLPGRSGAEIFFGVRKEQ